jgi:AraC-like DNA-binding protein
LLDHGLRPVRGGPQGVPYRPDRPPRREARKEGRAMLLLEQLLDGLDVTVEPFALCRAAAGERVDLGRNQRTVIHYVLGGYGRLVIDGALVVPLARGSAVIVPLGARQVLAAARGEGLMMACGTVRATYLTGRGLFDYLAEPIVAGGRDDPAFSHAFETMLDELSRPQPGTETLVRALMQQCLVLVLRRHCESGECRVPWLAALEDERLGRAVAAMLERPEAGFTVEQLAEVAGMSRSAFAERFARAFGRGPIEFLKEVRLRRAAALLAATDRPVKAVGAAVGYDSRSYFTRAFCALYGESPAAYRAARRRSGRRDEAVHHLLGAGLVERDLELVAVDGTDQAVAELPVEHPGADGKRAGRVAAGLDRRRLGAAAGVARPVAAAAADRRPLEVGRVDRLGVAETGVKGGGDAPPLDVLVGQLGDEARRRR